MDSLEIIEIKKVVFPIYGGKVQHPTDNCSFDFVGVNTDGKPIIKGDWSGGTNPCNTASWCEWEECKLILKPITEMTQEHVAECWGLVGKNPDYKDNDPMYPSLPTKKEYFLKYINGLNKKFPAAYEMLDFEENIIFIDYLRSKGYRISYMGKDLVELGVAIEKL